VLYMPAVERWTGVNRYALALRWVGLSFAGAIPVYIVAKSIILLFDSPFLFAAYALLLPLVAIAALLQFGLSARDRTSLLDVVRKKLSLNGISKPSA